MRPSLSKTMQSLGLLVMGLFVLGSPPPASAKVFASQNQALAEAFPEATRIERNTHVLRGGEVEKIERITRAKLEKKILVVHTAYKGNEVLGYAQIDVHNVRTKAEAFMVVLDPRGEARSVRVLAFHEPLDYLPTERWYSQFHGKTGADALRVGGDVHGVVGATLSARAAADGVRRMLAYWEVLLRPSVDVALPEQSEDAVSTVADVPGNAS